MQIVWPTTSAITGNLTRKPFGNLSLFFENLFFSSFDFRRVIFFIIDKMYRSACFTSFAITLAVQYALCVAEPRMHKDLNRITCPNHTHGACAGENVCLHPCNRHFLPTQTPTFFYENAPSDPEARLWIEVVPSAEAKQLYFNEITSTRPLYKHTLTPGSSGRIELGAIPEPGSYNIIMFQNKRTFEGVLSVEKFCISKF